MKILLIGGSGFIGSFVIEQLVESGHEVAVLHRGNSKIQLPANVKRILGDANRLADFREELRRLAPDVTVDFILSSGEQAEQMIGAMRGITARVIVLSSMDVYRACGVLHHTEAGELQPMPLTEESELRTQPAYSRQRLEMAKGIFSWMRDDYDKIPVERAVLSDSEIPVTVLRLPMVYGPGDLLHRFFPVIKRICDGRKRILFEEDIANWRGTKGYVENVALAITLAATSPVANGQIYNVAEEDTIPELEWAQLIAKQMKWIPEFVVLPNERTPVHLRTPGNFKQHWVASTKRIRQELGYLEKIPREEAVARTIKWELEHPPVQISQALFDYEAEDAALSSAA
jgi:nucleoside-diphosphate-sugar epimerase